VTFFRLLTNRRDQLARASSPELETEIIELLFSRMLKALKMPLSPAMVEIDRITALCGGDQIRCTPENSARLRQALRR
jgi:hypothetical protein